LTGQQHLAQPLRGGLTGAGLTHAGLALALSALLVASLGGCHRKILRPALPLASLAPIELEEPAVHSDSLPMIAMLPLPELGPLPPPPPPPKPAPRKKPATKEEAQPPVSGPPEEAALAIGALSIGGDAEPQSQQSARDLIAAILKRIAALPAKTADAQKKQIRQVRHFLDQAQQALNSGDADGAMNLATKAKLLMDDLEKK
jgi:hypothetical protein